MSYANIIKQRQKDSKITIKKASELMGVSLQTTRMLIRSGKVNFGTCIKEDGKDRYNYIINPKLFYEYLGKDNKNKFTF